LKITTEPLENRQLSLIIEVDEEQTQQAMRRAARQIAKQVNIPGFRKGKAPYELIVQRYGEDTIRREAVEALIEDAYDKALNQESIEPFSSAMLEDIQLHPITFRFTVPLRPTVDLGDYRGFRLKPPKIKIDKKQVKQALEEIRQDNAMLELVERPFALGDGVVIDLVGRTAEWEEFLNVEGVRLILEAEDDGPAPGFAAAIDGMEAGEERTFTLTLPGDFPQEELRGQEAEFTVKMVEVYDSTLPKLDDDLARTVGNFDSIKELEKHVKEQLQQAEQQRVDEQYAEQVLEAIVEQAQVEYPPVMLEREVDDIAKEFERVVKREARLSLDDYLRLQDKTMEELRDEFEPNAATRLKRALALGEVARLEKLEVDEEEVGTTIDAVSAPWGVRAEAVRTSLSSDAGRRALGSRLLANKAVQRLVAIAKGEAPEIGAAEASGEEESTEGQKTKETEEEA
jgi:trigger factor